MYINCLYIIIIKILINLSLEYSILLKINMHCNYDIIFSELNGNNLCKNKM